MSESLSKETTWGEWEELKDHIADYDLFEMGYNLREKRALFNTTAAFEELESHPWWNYNCNYYWSSYPKEVFFRGDIAFEQMEVDLAIESHYHQMESGSYYDLDIDSKEYQESFNSPQWYMEGEEIPQWKIDSDRIGELLSNERG
mgnify:CR=1 FL=1|tara:strand:- start:135 stop:569 length:435 start_codon:yes stop_codon:yes gene_type:complete